MSRKGKEVAGKDSNGKRKLNDIDRNDKTDGGGGRKKRNPNVVQFFDDYAAEVDGDEESSDDSFFDDDDFFVDEFPELKVKSEPGKAHQFPFIPKEEEITEEELDKMLEERFKSGSGFVTYAEDNYDSKRTVLSDMIMPSAKEPIIWKVKCTVGREKHSAFCLMQKFVDLSSLGTKLQIISAFAVEHIKGSIYVEADKQSDVLEACKGLCSIYPSRVALVLINEISHLLSVRSKSNEVSAGMWARVKNGKYKGDLAQVVAVNDVRKKATVQLIPRIDLQALMEKFGGVTVKKSSTPAPRLISSFELEEFRPMIQYRRDRDTNKVCEFLDGLMLKDGFLFKKVSIDSLSFWGVMPTEEELEKFKSSEQNDSKDLEWLSQLYGEERKKINLNPEKGGKGGKAGKGEGSSGSGVGNAFEVHDLVCFGKKDFGIIISVEKDDYYKIMKDSPAGPLLVTRELNELKTALFDKKFTALDQHRKSITIGDTVKVLDGALQGRQGIVKQIYRGTIFLYDENEEQNGGYFCSRSQMCEKVKLFDNSLSEKGGKSGNSGFEDFISSPKSPLSPQKPWQGRDMSESNRGDKEGTFSVGQSLRIRVGPLKGYLCRVLAIRRSDVTVKLDSKQKVLTVKIENLAEVRGKSSTFSQSGDSDSISIKPFDMLLNQGGSTDWMSGGVAAAEGNGWSAGGAEGSGWNAGGAEGGGWNAGGSSAGAAEGSGWNAGGSSAGAAEGSGLNAGGSSAGEAEGSGWNAGGSSAGAADGSGWNAGRSSAGVKEGNGWTAGVSSSERSSWPSVPASGTSVRNAKDNSTTAFGSVDNDPKKVADAAWDTRVASTQSASWGTASNEKAPANKAQVGGWGSQVNNATTESAFGISAANSWDKAEVPGAKGFGDNWGKGKMEIVNPAAGSDSWEKNKSSNEEVSWGKANNVTQSSTGSWNDVTKKNKSSTSGGGDWNMGGKCENDGVDGSAWGKAVESPGAGRDIQTKSWGNSSGSFSQIEAGNTDQATGWKKAISNDGLTGNWGCKKDIGENATGQSDKWDKPKSFSGTGASSWNKQGVEPKSFSGTGESWNKLDGGSSRNKDGSDKQESWEKPRSFDEGFGSGGRRGRGRGGRDNFGGGRSFSRGQSDWNKQGQDNYQAGRGTSTGNSSGWSREQTGGWSKSKDFGGVRINDWDKSNASGEDNVSNQNKGWGGGNETDLNGNKWTSQSSDRDRGVSGNQSSTWNTGNQNASKSSDISWSAAGNKGFADDRVGWNESKVSEEAQKKSWNSNTTVVAGSQSSGWGNKSNDQGSAGWKSADGKDTGANEESGWDNKKGWNTPRGSQDTPSRWNKKSSGDEKDTMNSGKTSEGVSAPGWGQSSEWKTGTGEASKGSWNSGVASGGDVDKDDWNTAKPTGGAPASGGGWEGKFLGGNQSSSWGRGNFSAKEDDSTKSSNWLRGDDFGGRGGSDRGRGGFRGRPHSDRGGYGGRDYSDRGGYGGRGSSDRGGFGGRDRGDDFGGRGDSDRGRGGFRGRPHSDRGGYGGRDYSDRGGYGGRGSSDRGGFGGRDGGGFRGRGRGRRDQNSDGNNNDGNNNDSGQDKPFSSWSSGGGNTNRGEWKGNTGTSSWNQGGGGKNWNSVLDSSKDTAASGSDWTSHGASWNQLTEGNKSGNSITVQAGGWNKGPNSTNEADGSKSGGWASGDNAQANYKGRLETPKQDAATSNQAGGWNSQSSSWNKSSGTAEVVPCKPQTGGWGGNQAGDSNSQGTGWNQSSAGNEVAPTKRQTGGWGGNQAGASNSQGTGWNQSAGATEIGDSKRQAGGWG